MGKILEDSAYIIQGKTKHRDHLHKYATLPKNATHQVPCLEKEIGKSINHSFFLLVGDGNMINQGDETPGKMSRGHCFHTLRCPSTLD